MTDTRAGHSADDESRRTSDTALRTSDGALRTPHGTVGTSDGTVRTSDGAVLAYQVLGPVDAPPLLLLPGQANSHVWWSWLRERYALGFRTITFDYRGTGATDATNETMPDWSTTSFAADAIAVLDAVGVERADVYATSMGGRVAQMLALNHPKRLRRLVLACTSPGGALAVERGREVRQSLILPDAADRRAALLNLFYTPEWSAKHGDSSSLLGDPTMKARDSVRHLKVSSTHAAGERLTEIAAPTLVLHGTDDLLVPTVNAPTLARLIPNARLSLTDGARHGFFDEFNDEVDPEILDFLAD